MKNENEHSAVVTSSETPKPVLAWLRIWLFQQEQCQQLLLQTDSSNMEDQL